MARKYRIENLKGQKFGKLTAIKQIVRVYWVCRCECGRVLDIRPDALKRQTSCGCAHRRMPTAHSGRHGLSHTPENAIWRSIVGRCTIPSHTSWRNYGGRGIKVCKRWLNDFVAFYEDMGPRPSSRHSVERKNNNGPYSPKNCIWATPDVQQNNRRSNVNLTHAGRTQNLGQWARETGIKRETIALRIRLGWPVEKALTKPVMFKSQAWRQL